MQGEFFDNECPFSFFYFAFGFLFSFVRIWMGRGIFLFLSLRGTQPKWSLLTLGFFSFGGFQVLFSLLFSSSHAVRRGMAVERIESGSLSGGGKDGDWEWLYVSVFKELSAHRQEGILWIWGSVPRSQQVG